MIRSVLTYIALIAIGGSIGVLAVLSGCRQLDAQATIGRREAIREAASRVFGIDTVQQ
jgi:hypothetical protein